MHGIPFHIFGMKEPYYMSWRSWVPMVLMNFKQAIRLRESILTLRKNLILLSFSIQRLCPITLNLDTLLMTIMRRCNLQSVWSILVPPSIGLIDHSPSYSPLVKSTLIWQKLIWYIMLSLDHCWSLGNCLLRISLIMTTYLKSRVSLNCATARGNVPAIVILWSHFNLKKFKGSKIVLTCKLISSG